MCASYPRRVTSPLDNKLSNALGGRTATAFQKHLGLETVGDLLSYYPRRYAKRGELTALADLELDTNVTIIAKVLSVSNRQMKAKRGSIFEATITDGKGILTLTFFNQSWRDKELVPGVTGMFAGKVGAYKGLRQLAHPDYELFAADDERAQPRPNRRMRTGGSTSRFRSIRRQRASRAG